jgi:hypothetical protein
MALDMIKCDRKGEENYLQVCSPLNFSTKSIAQDCQLVVLERCVTESIISEVELTMDAKTLQEQILKCIEPGLVAI